ncbi:MAG: sigma factor-like helix-turn-helix DNA-binding protein [Pirellulaceae bacterium]
MRLDEELRRVRETYRAVLVEHYLMGKTAAEIAASCSLSQSTIEGALAAVVSNYACKCSDVALVFQPPSLHRAKY